MAFSKKYKSIGNVFSAYKLVHLKEQFQFKHQVVASARLIEDLAFDLDEIPIDG